MGTYVQRRVQLWWPLTHKFAPWIMVDQWCTMVNKMPVGRKQKGENRSSTSYCDWHLFCIRRANVKQLYSGSKKKYTLSNFCFILFHIHADSLYCKQTKKCKYEINSFSGQFLTFITETWTHWGKLKLILVPDNKSSSTSLHLMHLFIFSGGHKVVMKK